MSRWNIFKALHRSSSTKSEPFEPSSALLVVYPNTLSLIRTELDNIESLLRRHHHADETQSQTISAFNSIVATLEGLLAVIAELRKEYDNIVARTEEYDKLKALIGNHHRLVTQMQEAHAEQVSTIYQAKTKVEQSLAKKEEDLLAQRKLSEDQSMGYKTQLEQLKGSLQSVKGECNILQVEVIELRRQNRQLHDKLSAILALEQGDSSSRKQVSLDNVNLEIICYYSKLRQMLFSYLDVDSYLNLKQANHFLHYTLRREQSKQIYTSTSRIRDKTLMKMNSDIRAYQKMFEMFPADNVKINAMKYLYFRARPGGYILPFLHEDYELEKLGEKEEIQDKDKSWKSIFLRKERTARQDKNGKGNQKDHSEANSLFNFNNFSNSNYFQTVQGKVEEFFRNILPLSGNDLRNYASTTTRQFEELKGQLREHIPTERNKLTLGEWAAQLACLSRFLYLETCELHNLLLVVFGFLVKRNQEWIHLQQLYEETRDNETAIRHLIESLSKGRMELERKLFSMENQFLRTKLEKEGIEGQLQRMSKEWESAVRAAEASRDQLLQFKGEVERTRAYRKAIEAKLHKIDAEIDALNHVTSTKQRRGSIDSISSRKEVQTNQLQVQGEGSGISQV